MSASTGGSGLVRRAVLTSAKVYESTVADRLICGDEKAVYGDRAYEHKERRARLKAAGIKDRIMHRRHKHMAALPLWQQRRNRLISRHRAPVEAVFSALKRLYGQSRAKGLTPRKKHRPPDGRGHRLQPQTGQPDRRTLSRKAHPKTPNRRPDRWLPPLPLRIRQGRPPRPHPNATNATPDSTPVTNRKQPPETRFQTFAEKSNRGCRVQANLSLPPENCSQGSFAVRRMTT